MQQVPLNAEERNDFTSWFAKLTLKERETVGAVLARTDLERIRIVLSISPKDRIAFFLVKKSPCERMDQATDQWAEKAAATIEDSTLVKQAREINEQRRKRGWIKRLFGI